MTRNRNNHTQKRIVYVQDKLFSGLIICGKVPLVRYFFFWYNVGMKIIITEEMKQEALRKRQEADRLANNFNNEDPSEPENICISCE